MHSSSNWQEGVENRRTQVSNRSQTWHEPACSSAKNASATRLLCLQIIRPKQSRVDNNAVHDNCVIHDVNETRISTLSPSQFPSKKAFLVASFQAKNRKNRRSSAIKIHVSHRVSLRDGLLFRGCHPLGTGHWRERSPSAYQVLQSYGLPVALLPKGITGYQLHEATGEFTASMNGTCRFTLENSYQLKYEQSIEGVIERERLRRLKGVSVKVTVVWLSIVEVVRQGGNLEFSIGVASAGFPVENFTECPWCGCGLACNATVSEFRASSSSSSLSSS